MEAWITSDTWCFVYHETRYRAMVQCLLYYENGALESTHVELAARSGHRAWTRPSLTRLQHVLPLADGDVQEGYLLLLLLQLSLPRGISNLERLL